jgi:hypothetical protein
VETTPTGSAGIRSSRRTRHSRARRAIALGLGLLVAMLPGVSHAGFLNLEWNEPTTNADGSPLTDLAGYRVYSGTSTLTCPGPGFVSISAPVPDPTPGQTFAASLTSLTPGTTYFIRVSAVDSSGNESPCTPAVSGQARADIAATPASLAFGDVNVGSSATLDLTVQNLGPATMTGTASASAPFSVVSGGSLNIAPGGSQVVRVRFAPTVAQTYAGNVVVTTNADDVSRPLSGIGVDGTPSVVQFSQATFSVTEAGVATLTVTRTGGTAGGVTVQYATGGGSATAGSDYTAASGTLTFGAGQSSRTFAVTTLADAQVEGTETVGLTLSNPQGATLGTRTTAALNIADDDVAGTLRLANSTYTVAEGGGNVTIQVTRTGGAAAGVTVGYATANGTATAGADYSARTGTLSFGAGVTTRSFTVPVLADATAEGSESFTVALNSPGGGATLGSPTTATVTITDDDAAGTIGFATAAYTVSEDAGTVSIPVTRTGGAAGGVSIGYATANGSAAAGSDYTAQTGTLTFGAGVTTQTVTVPILADGATEAAETFTVRLSSPTAGATLGTPSVATVTITDGAPRMSVRFSTDTYKTSETSRQATITVTRVGGTTGVVTVNYATTGGAATPGVDFVPVSGTLTFASGQTSRTFTVPVLDDDLVDGPRTVSLALTSPVGADLGAPGTATLTITDNDVAGTVQFAAGAFTVDEGAGTAHVIVRRSGGAAAGTGISYTVTGGSATPGADFTLSGGALTFARGATTATIPITLVADALAEGPETIELTLSDPTGGAVLGAVSRARVTIDEMEFQFAPAVYTVTEGGRATVTVVRTGPVTRPATVDWTTSDGSAVTGQDYLAGAGMLSFAAGVRSRTFTVTTVSDSVVEPDETVLLTLRNPGGGAVLGEQVTAALTIRDNDAGGRLGFAPASHRVPESRGTLEVPVARSGGVASDVTVRYRVTGGTAAGGGVDYALTAGTLTFAAGQTRAVIPVTLANDGLVESDETVVLSLEDPTGGATIGAAASVTITITDDDRTSTLQLATASSSVLEGAGGATVTVTRTGITTTPVSVTLATSNGSATAGSDYTAVNATVTFPAGVTRQTVTIPILPNVQVDGTRTVNLVLSGATAPAGLGPISSGVLSILDDDSVLSLDAASYTVNEGGAATVTVHRTGSLQGAVSVDYALTGLTATATDDFPTGSGRLTFGPGVARRTLAVRTLTDALVEGAETLRLDLRAPLGQATLGTPASATVAIADAPPVVRFAGAAYAVSEGKATATVTVVRTGQNRAPATVNYAAAGGTASSGVDYTLVPGTLTFEPGVTSRTFTVGVVDDGLPETPETIVLQLGGATGAVVGTPGTTTLTIVDNEPQVRFGAAAYGVRENARTATLTVLRSGASSVPVTVAYQVVGGTATSGADYAVSAGTLTFEPGVNSRTITMTIADDGVPENPETVEVALTGASGASLGTPSTTTLTIIDDEPQVRFSAAAYSVSETTPAVTITAVRVGPTTGTVTVDYAVAGGTASSGADFSLDGTGTLTFGPGVRSQTFKVNLVNDSVVETKETIHLALANPVNAALASPSEAVVHVTSNDLAGTVRFASPVYTQSVNGAQAVIALMRTGGWASDISVDVTTQDGTAQAGVHYAPVTTRVTFAAGQAVATVSVPLIGGSLNGAGRWLSLLLTTAGPSPALSIPSTAVLWIADAP